MQISLLSGAYKNAGDFLIVHRSKELIKDIFPDCEIVEYERRNSIEDKLDEINQSDVLILDGGPGYVSNLYPKVMPLTEDLNKITVPIFAMAMGWWGNNGFADTIYHYKFSDSTIKLLNRIEADGFPLGCRDFFSERVLWSHGIKNTIMTGCAAWYDFDYLDQTNVKNNEVHTIYLSEPARPQNYEQFIEVIKFLLIRYPNAELQVLFHRGIGSDQLTSKSVGEKLARLCTQLSEMGIPYDDISYGYDKLEKYKECDLHIGYRVHAHIFNLSQRRRSILIQEDSRGIGVNQALGLENIYAFRVQKEMQNQILQKGFRKFYFYGRPSEYICKELKDYLNILEEMDWVQYDWAFQRMRYYYLSMQRHLNQLKKLSK